MQRAKLIDSIKKKGTYLCVGLDTDPRKLPSHLKDDPDGVFNFNKQIIEATREHCVAYKLNTAFYEAQGLKGWEDLGRTAAYIGNTHLRIADAKRGDIGNTSSMYARSFFDIMPFDAVTVAPYMGEDSIRPFLEYKNKWTIVLGLTSNKGSEDFQKLQLENGEPLYQSVISRISKWGDPDNLMFVIGATQSDEVRNIRNLVPDHFFLVPGVGAQGGNLREISKVAMNGVCGLLVNASRSIIYASAGEDFAEKAKSVAQQLQKEMEALLGE